MTGKKLTVSFFISTNKNQFWLNIKFLERLSHGCDFNTLNSNTLRIGDTISVDYDLLWVYIVDSLEGVDRIFSALLSF